MLGKEINQAKFEELFKNTSLGCLTLDEIIDIAMNGEGMNSGSEPFRLWTFAGAYYRFDDENVPMLIIDREFNCEYNNDEILLKDVDGYIISNHSTFTKLIVNKVAEKTKFTQLVNESKKYSTKTEQSNTTVRFVEDATYGPFNEIDSL